MAKKALATIMEAKVTRKQFLVMLGFGLIGLTGISGVMDMLTKHSSNTAKQGYGFGPYGGEASVVKSANAANKLYANSDR